MVVPEMPLVVSRLGSLKAGLVIAVSRDPAGGTGVAAGQLVDPEKPRRDVPIFPGPPTIVVHDPSAVKLLDSLPGGLTGATVSLWLSQSMPREV